MVKSPHSAKYLLKKKTAWDLREDDKFYTRTEASREI